MKQALMNNLTKQFRVENRIIVLIAWGTILFYAFTEINKLMDFEGVKETLSYSTIYRDQVKQSFIEEVQSRRETRYFYSVL